MEMGIKGLGFMCCISNLGLKQGSNVNHKVHGLNSLRVRSFVPYLRKDSHYSEHCAWIKFSFVFYVFCECVVFQVHLLLCCFCRFFFFVVLHNVYCCNEKN